MSISAATNVAFARRLRTPSLRSLQELEAATGGVPDSKSSVMAAVGAIATYIPSEILTLYVSVLAAMQTTDATGTRAPTNGAWVALIFFFFATPVVVWVVYATKVRLAGKPLPKSPAQWPMWEMCSATIAFLAWSYAMPNSPFAAPQMASWYSAPVAGIIVLVVSATLGLVAPLFTQRPLP